MWSRVTTSNSESVTATRVQERVAPSRNKHLPAEHAAHLSTRPHSRCPGGRPNHQTRSFHHPYNRKTERELRKEKAEVSEKLQACLPNFKQMLMFFGFGSRP